MLNKRSPHDRQHQSALTPVAAMVILLVWAGWGCGGAVGPRNDTQNDGDDQKQKVVGVEEAVSMDKDGPISVQGMLFVDEDGLRLYSAVLESYPPQGGGASLALVGMKPDSIVGLSDAREMNPESVLQWTDFPVTLSGTLQGGTLHVEATPQVSTAESNGMLVRSSHHIRESGGLETEDQATQPASDGLLVFWAFDVTNTTNEQIALLFSDGQRMEVVLNKNGEEVYRWSSGKAFTQAIEQVNLAPGESWEYSANDELEVDPGRYDFEAWITAGELETGILSGSFWVR